MRNEQLLGEGAINVEISLLRVPSLAASCPRVYRHRRKAK